MAKRITLAAGALVAGMLAPLAAGHGGNAMRNLVSALLTSAMCGLAAAQPCTPDFIDEPELHRYQVLASGLTLMTFHDVRGPAVYAGLSKPDLRGANILRLTGAEAEPGSVQVSSDPLQIMTLHAFDADGPGPEPAHLHAAGYSGNRVWRLAGTEWHALPDQLPPAGREIRDITGFDDGSGYALYATGNFGTKYGLRYEEGPHGLARWDDTAQEWAPVGGGIWSEAGATWDGPIGRVMAVFDEDGAGAERPALFIGGAFDHAGEMAVPGLVRWDGAEFSLVGELERDDGKPVIITELFVHDDGSGKALYIGGTFHKAGGVRSPGLVRWDGERFYDVGGGLPLPPSVGASGHARTLSTWREDGRDLLLVGGSWLRWAPAPEAFHAPLVLWDGAEWRPLMSEGLEAGPHILDAVAVFEDGEQIVYIAGTFREIEGRFIEGVARWDGERWSGYNSGLGKGVRDLHVFDDGAGAKLILSQPELIGEQFWDGLAAWDGDQFSEYPIRGLEGESVQVYGVTEVDGRRRMFLGTAGEPTRTGTGISAMLWEYDGSGVTQVAELNKYQPRSNYRVHIFEYDDGSGPALHLAGDFFDIDLQTVHDVVKRDGEEWVTLGEGLRFAADTQSPSVIVFDNGSGPAIYVGGRNMSIGGEDTPGGLARWDGEKWHGSVGDYQLPGGIPGECWDLEVYQGKLHAILALEHPAGHILPGVARLDGETWAVLGLTNPERFGMIRDLHVFDDGSGEKLYVVGEFPELGGVDARGGIIWDGESWTPMSGGFDPLIAGRGPQTMAVYDAGDGEGPDLYIGGNYRTVIDATGEVIPTGRLARWGGCRDSCPADLTGDGALDFADFLAFQTLFAAMDPRADFDGDSAFTFFDFLAFQNAFAAGCP